MRPSQAARVTDVAACRSSRCLNSYVGTAALAAVCLILVLSSAALAQSKSRIKPYAVIIGTVFDQTGRTVPGVKIKIQRHGDKHPKWELVSDNNGEFAQRFPAGKADYTIWAELKGKKGHVSETKIHIENDERQDIGLHLPE